jgi:hypothetical protein
MKWSRIVGPGAPGEGLVFRTGANGPFQAYTDFPFRQSGTAGRKETRSTLN